MVKQNREVPPPPGLSPLLQYCLTVLSGTGYKATGKFFKGLALSGASVRSDEFNHRKLEVIVVPVSWQSWHSMKITSLTTSLTALTLNNTD